MKKETARLILYQLVQSREALARAHVAENPKEVIEACGSTIRSIGAREA